MHLPGSGLPKQCRTPATEVFRRRILLHALWLKVVQACHTADSGGWHHCKTERIVHFAVSMQPSHVSGRICAQNSVQMLVILLALAYLQPTYMWFHQLSKGIVQYLMFTESAQNC